MITHNDSTYLSLALQLAARGRFTVSPNPMVGCVLVKDGQIVGQGYHQKAGEGHAEVLAISEAGEAAHGATAYVSLEPCCHYGRTPPCTDALIKAGIKRVVVGSTDPNPLVGGKGIELLKVAGIEVELNPDPGPYLQLNEIFFHYIQRSQPFVMAKWAMSLDGKTIANASDSPQISGSESQAHTHELRQAVDAILVGARTARIDNPQLTVRVSPEENAPLKQPLRVILAGRETLPFNLKIFDPALPGKTLLVTTKAEDELLFQPLLSDKFDLLRLPADEEGLVPLDQLLFELGKREICSVLVEGGMKIHESFFAKQLVNKVQVYLAPVFIGSLANKQRLQISEQMSLGGDFHFSAKQEESSHV